MKLFSKKKVKTQRLNLMNNKDVGEEAEFVNDRKQSDIGLKSSLIEYAAIKRELKVERLNRRMIIVYLRNGTRIAFHNMNGNSSSRVGMSICNSKYESRDLLKNNGLSVTEAKKFKKTSYKKAVEYVKEIGFPVVVKPTHLARSRGVTTNIDNFDELKEAWDYAFSVYKKNRNMSNVIIEQHVQGEDFRFFVVGDEMVSATHRKRASVIGDGSSNILKLVQQKNLDRFENPYMSAYLIPEELAKLDGLEEKGLTFESIPEKGEEVSLYSRSNPAAGRDSVDVTDRIHPDYRSVAVNALKSIPGIDYAGVDIISTDITAKPSNSNHIIGEIESSPAPLTHFPLSGKERDMAGAIVEYYLQQNHL